ncbi:MAG: cytochrome c biogenesis protein CcsA [Alphaproteobacteria bacterium]|nr:cytochrome c biogenesis protein CcsA [Alphaproteobacteria bacterium]
MSASLILAAGAIAALVPLGVVARESVDVATATPRFWIALVVAAAGSMGGAVLQQFDGWQTGLGPALSLAIATTVAVFAVVAAFDRSARRLAPMLTVYLVALGVLAVVWQQAPGRPLRSAVFPAWLLIHIAVALVAYGLLTVAAVASGGVVLQERALRRKRPTNFTRRLPAIADGERIQTRLLVAVEILLGVTLATGVVVNRAEGLGWLPIDHKTVLSILAFVVIAGLLLLHSRFGLSGRRGARYGLIAYLLVTLAYPGVKFVTDVLMARGG